MNRSLVFTFIILSGISFLGLGNLPFAHSDSAMDGWQQKSGEMREMKSPKNSLAPHTVVIQAALQSAMDQLKGIRNELQITSPPSAEMIDNLKMQSREINTDLRSAMSHEMHLQSGVKKFPELAGKDEYRAVSKALDDLETYNQSWQGKTARNDYWKNKEMVQTDLDRLERQLVAALDKTRLFSSEQLGYTPSVG